MDDCIQWTLEKAVCLHLTNYFPSASDIEENSSCYSIQVVVINHAMD